MQTYPARRRPALRRLGRLATSVSVALLFGAGCTGPMPGQPIVLPAPTPPAPSPEAWTAPTPGESGRPADVPAQGAPSGSATGSPVPTAIGGSPEAANCPASGVLISTSATDAAMGLRGMGIVLFNCGTEPLPLYGYPVVRVLDAGHDPLPVRVENGSRSTGEDPGPKEITVYPGGTAHASVRWRNTVTDGDPAQGEYLEVAPAAGRPTQIVAKRLDLGTTGRLEVHAWAVR
ncbi:DUF4232 domain-containing protein [Micromonospora sp. NPDC049523]|uniref:DUF4232 domain-containing protein n=1 Tax=Micromonospora sp. NPDC049523 TaxID=3155921 RepID=UPI003424FFB5